MKSKKITLKTALKIGDEDVREITVRSPAAGELRGLSLAALAELEVDTVLKLVPRVTVPMISEEAAESLSLVDLLSIGGAIVNPDGDASGNGGTIPSL